MGRQAAKVAQLPEDQAPTAASDSSTVTKKQHSVLYGRHSVYYFYCYFYFHFSVLLVRRLIVVLLCRMVVSMIQLQEESISVCASSLEVCRLSAGLWVRLHDVPIILHAATPLVQGVAELLQTYMTRQELFSLGLAAGLGVPHSQECGPTPDHCQEAQLEGLGPQQKAGLEGVACQQEAHQCIPLLTSGLALSIAWKGQKD